MLGCHWCSVIIARLCTVGQSHFICVTWNKFDNKAELELNLNARLIFFSRFFFFQAIKFFLLCSFTSYIQCESYQFRVRTEWNPDVNMDPSHPALVKWLWILRSFEEHIFRRKRVRFVCCFFSLQFLFRCDLWPCRAWEDSDADHQHSGLRLCTVSSYWISLLVADHHHSSSLAA